MLKGFREFVMRGNVVDLAVGIVLGAAFSSVVNAVVDGLINPIIAAIFGKPDLSDVARFTINNAQFSIGLILSAIINFVLIAAAVYFFVVIPVNRLRARYERPTEPGAPNELTVLEQIRDELRARP